MNYFTAYQSGGFLKTWRQEKLFVLKHVLRIGNVIDYKNHYTDRDNKGECRC